MKVIANYVNENGNSFLVEERRNCLEITLYNDSNIVDKVRIYKDEFNFNYDLVNSTNYIYNLIDDVNNGHIRGSVFYNEQWYYTNRINSIIKKNKLIDRHWKSFV